MANNNSIHILRGSPNSDEKLYDGQPFYNIDKNYLTIGTDTNNTTNSSPITVRELIGYTSDDSYISNSKQNEFSIKHTDNSLNMNSPDSISLRIANNSKIDVKSNNVSINDKIIIDSKTSIENGNLQNTGKIKNIGNIDNTGEIISNGDILVQGNHKVVSTTIETSNITNNSDNIKIHPSILLEKIGKVNNTYNYKTKIKVLGNSIEFSDGNDGNVKKLYYDIGINKSNNQYDSNFSALGVDSGFAIHGISNAAKIHFTRDISLETVNNNAGENASFVSINSTDGKKGFHYDNTATFWFEYDPNSSTDLGFFKINRTIKYKPKTDSDFVDLGDVKIGNDYYSLSYSSNTSTLRFTKEV